MGELEFLEKVLGRHGVVGVLALAAAGALLLLVRSGLVRVGKAKDRDERPTLIRLKELRARVDELVEEIEGDVAALRAELREAVKTVRDDLAREIGELREELKGKAGREIADERARLVREQLEALARQLAAIEGRLEHILTRRR